MSGDVLNRYIRQLWLYLLGCVVLVAVDNLGWASGIKSVFQHSVAPIELGMTKIVRVVRSPVETLVFYKNGVAKIVDLEARLRERMVDYQELERLRQENEHMRKLLGTDLPPEWKFVPARVLGGGNDVMLLWVGSAEGIKEGMTVVSEKVLVGKVVSVTDRVSEVRLVQSSVSKIAVTTVGGTAQGLAVGVNGRIEMQQILQDQVITVGELVESRGTDELLPGLLVGKVSEVEVQASEAYKTAIIEPVIRVDSLEYVSVVLDGGGT